MPKTCLLPRQASLKRENAENKIVVLMRMDKFGIGSLLLGIVLLLAMLQFVFMTPEVGGWSATGLVNAIVVTLEGGLILLGLILVAMGLLLLLL